MARLEWASFTASQQIEQGSEGFDKCGGKLTLAPESPSPLSWVPGNRQDAESFGWPTTLEPT